MTGDLPQMQEPGRAAGRGSGRAPGHPATIEDATFARLLVRNPPRSGEHAGGYWLRVAHDNGLIRPRWLLPAAGGSPMSLARVCPACLSKPDPIWLEPWGRREMPACATHRAWLADTCTGCKRPVRWGAVRLLACFCDHDLRSLPSTPMTAHAQRALFDDRVPLAVLLWLGALVLHGLDGKPLKKATRQRMQDVIALAHAGAEAVQDWPTGLHRALDACQAPRSGQGPELRLLNHALPGLTRRIRKIADPAWRALIDKALGEYVQASHREGEPLIGRNAPGARPTTVAGYARVAGVRPLRLPGAFDRLPGSEAVRRQTAGGRARRLVTQDTAAQARRLLADQITPKEAARTLGLTVRRIQALVKAGQLVSPGGPPDTLSGAAVAAHRQRLAAVLSCAPRPADATTLAHALRLWVPMDRTAGLLDAMAAGRIPLHGPARTMRAANVWVSEKAVRAWVSTPQEVARSWLTIPECAERLGIKQEVAYHLVRKALIRTERVNSGRRMAQVVPLGALEVFQGEFETLARAAQRAGVDHRAGLEWARANGVELVSGPGVDGGRQYFVRRSASAVMAPGDGPPEAGEADFGSGDL